MQAVLPKEKHKANGQKLMRSICDNTIHLNKTVKQK